MITIHAFEYEQNWIEWIAEQTFNANEELAQLRNEGQHSSPVYTDIYHWLKLLAVVAGCHRAMTTYILGDGTQDRARERLKKQLTGLLALL
jgi:hypothetical protein